MKPWLITYETPSQAIRRYSALLKTEVPLTAKTIVFSFFTGSILSFPVGAILATVRPFEPPEWTGPIYLCAFFGSLLLLPFWSCALMRDQPLLGRIGLRFSLFSYVGLLISGVLFPSVS